LLLPQYSGPRKDAAAYADWVKKDRRFCDMLVQTSPALAGHAFPRLKLRYKPSLVQVSNPCCKGNKSFSSTGLAPLHSKFCFEELAGALHCHLREKKQ
jgi:predicted sulfurtransferase